MRVFLAGLLSGVIGILIEWAIHTRFIRYRRKTPATWRARDTRLYLLGSAALMLSGFTYAGFFAVTGGIGWLNVRQWVQVGLLFGFGCWAALVLPVLLTVSIFVNLHRGVAIGMLLNWLLISLCYGLVCASVIVRLDG